MCEELKKNSKLKNENNSVALETNPTALNCFLLVLKVSHLFSQLFFVKQVILYSHF